MGSLGERVFEFPDCKGASRFEKRLSPVERKAPLTQNKWLSAKAHEFCKRNQMDLFMDISSKTSENVDKVVVG